MDSDNNADPDPTRASQPRSIQSLPNNAITSILQCCSDFPSIMSLAMTSEAIRNSIYQQQWLCARCSTRLFLDAGLTTPPQTNPFMCAVCHSKICGESTEPHCQPRPCSGCGQVQCSRCVGEGAEYYCGTCQQKSQGNL